MRSPLERIRRGAGVLGGISLVSVTGYYLLLPERYDLLDAIYWFVITVSSVGYANRPSDLSPEIQLFTIAVILIGMSAAGYTIGGFIQLMTEGEIERAMGVRRITRGIERLKDHVIICGFGRIGKLLADDLHRQKLPFVVIDTEQEAIAEALHLDYLVISGDATEEEIMLDAGVERAKTIVSGLNSDAANVFITLSARGLNPNLRIIARGEHPSSEAKLKQAGADRVVMPAVIGARRISTMVTRPLTADLIDQVTDQKILDVDLEELPVGETSSLVGQTVRGFDARRRHGMLVVAVRHREGQMIFNPDADYTFGPGDIMIVMGRPEEIEQFRQRYEIETH